VVIISNTEPLATQKLKDIRNEILANPELQDTYGVRFPVKRPGETQFIVESQAGQVAFMAFGRGAQVRGVRFGAYRPTKVICDDVEHSDEVHNERIRQKTHDWFFEDVVKVGDTGTTIEVVGTVLHKQSLLSELIRNPAYDGEIYKSVISWADRQDLWEKWERIYTDLDNDKRSEDAQRFYEENRAEMLKGTKVLWPEKEDYLALMKEMIEIGKRAFWKEKQNSPLGADEAVFDRVHWYRETSINNGQTRGIVIESTDAFIAYSKLTPNAYGVLDPSTGQVKAKSGKLGDWTCLLSGFKDPNGRVLVHEDWTKRVPPTKYIEAIFEHHEKYQYQKFGVETNLYRNLLMPNILAERQRREAQRNGELLKLPFYDIEQVENKTERIYRLEPKVSHGWIVFNRALSQEFKQQLEDFPHADHDDCPDALEMLWSLIHDKYRASAVVASAMSGR